MLFVVMLDITLVSFLTDNVFWRVEHFCIKKSI